MTDGMDRKAGCKNVLLVTDRYYPEPYANGICVHYVARSLVQAGHTAHILAYDIPGKILPEEKDGVRVFGVQPDLMNRMIFAGQNQISSLPGKLLKTTGIILLRLNKIRLISRFPLASESFHRNLVKQIAALDQQYHYDAVIGAYNPLDTVLAAAEYKQFRPDIKMAVYNLDYMPESIKNHVSAEKMKKSCDYWQDVIYTQADMILDMETNYRRWGQEYQEKWQDRIALTGLPLFVSEEVKPAGVFDHSFENWVYAGALDTAYYQIEEAMKIFCALPDQEKRVLHIYGRGTGYELCRKYAAAYPGRIIMHGFVSHEELKGILKEADILLSMKKTNLISGKTFEYMATGNTVVHLQGSEQDPNSDYLRQYNRSVIVRSDNQTSEEAAVNMARKLGELAAETGRADNQEAFRKNTPEYTRDLILNMLK